MAEWDLDWSYGYLRGLMAKIGKARRFFRLCEADEALASTSPVVFVRHDIDCDLGRALPMARLEHEWGLISTYHVMTESPFYDPFVESSREILAGVAACGHEIGLHFSPPSAPATMDQTIEALARECDRFEERLGISVRSISFHLPSQGLMRGPLRITGRVNAYAAQLLERYVSDSRGRWREGEPTRIVETPERVLQILTHPLWWGEDNARPEDRLGVLVDEIAARMGRDWSAVADRMDEHIIFRAKRPGA